MSNQPVALVVGASRGIGRQIAVDLAKNNYNGRDQSFPGHFIYSKTVEIAG